MKNRPYISKFSPITRDQFAITTQKESFPTKKTRTEANRTLQVCLHALAVCNNYKQQIHRFSLNVEVQGVNLPEIITSAASCLPMNNICFCLEAHFSRLGEAFQ